MVFDRTDTMWETMESEGEPTEVGDGSLLSSELCGCGCGEPAVEGAEVHAVLLKVARESLHKLEMKAKSGGERERQAEVLMWAWKRCEKGFVSYVHGYPMWECGPPTPLWITSWCRRVDRL